MLWFAPEGSSAVVHQILPHRQCLPVTSPSRLWPLRHNLMVLLQKLLQKLLAVPTLHRSLRVRCFDPRDFWALKDTSRARPEIDISPTERSRSIHRENDEETLLRPPQAVTSACHIFFDLFSDIFSLLVAPSKGRALGIPGPRDYDAI
jgi:hypothetical protein